MGERRPSDFNPEAEAATTVLNHLHTNIGEWYRTFHGELRKHQGEGHNFVSMVGRALDHDQLREPLRFPVQTEGEAFYTGVLLGLSLRHAERLFDPECDVPKVPSYEKARDELFYLNPNLTDRRSIDPNMFVALGKQAFDRDSAVQGVIEGVDSIILSDPRQRHFCESGSSYGAGSVGAVREFANQGIGQLESQLLPNIEAEVDDGIAKLEQLLDPEVDNGESSR